MGKPKDPEYWRRWRAAHPEYRERERERKRKRTPEQRQVERARAKHRAQVQANVRESKRLYAAKRRATQPLQHEAAEAHRARQRAWWHANAPERNAARRWERRRRKDMRIMEAAASVAQRYVKRDERSAVLDPLYEDALGTAALAIVAGQNPHAAVQQVVRTERWWRRQLLPLHDEVLS